MSAGLGEAPPPAVVLGQADAPARAPEAVYQERLARFGRERDRLTQQWNRVANLRLAAFVAAALCLGGGLWRGVLAADFVALVGFGAFVALVEWHNRLGRARRRATELWAITGEAIARLARDWDALPVRHTVRADATHPYAADLDLFGRASLMQLLDTVSTPLGEATLSGWLLAPAPPDTVRARQPAVAELAPLLDLRDHLALEGRMMGRPAPDPARFLAWAESAPWLAQRQGLLWIARLSVVLTWAGIGAQVSGLVDYPVWAIFVVLNGLLMWLLGRQAMTTLEQVASGEKAFSHYADAFALLCAAPFAAPLLHSVQADLTAGGQAAPRYMRRLHRLATLGFPHDSIMYIPVHLLTLWDIHVCAALETWQAAAGRHARAWLAALGEAEALAALASLAHDNPAWVFPTLDPAAAAVTADRLGHPYLPGAARVANDVTVGPPGTFLLVTGSNMSGKSTLLRAIGVNAVLAQAGGPVCAAALCLPPVALWTSMRIQDSLEQGVSYFMAELQRLKAVVDAARPAAAAPGAPRLLYLLDEILQGTNTAERQIAARLVILYLVHQGALGAVSTHDLTLAAHPEIAAAARSIHFTEAFANGPSGPTMSFDYQIRPGIATSTNALRLMQIVGLDVGADEA